MGPNILAHIQGSIIYFLQSGSPIIFFSHIEGSDIFFKKNHSPPLEIKWGVPNMGNIAKIASLIGRNVVSLLFAL